MSFYLLKAVGDTAPETGRLMSLVWSGGCQIGDVAELVEIRTGKVVWSALAGATAVYVGVSFTQSGITVLGGVRLSKHTTPTNAQVFVYFQEL